MSSDVSSSTGNTSSGGPYIPPGAEGVSGIETPPAVQPQGETQAVEDIVYQTFDEQSKNQTPDAANPKILQPEVNQAILSNSDALRMMLMNNMLQIMSSGNGPNVELAAKLYGMDPSLLHRLSQEGFDFSSAHGIENSFNAKINDIISNMWDKFNEVIADLKQRDQEWIRSGAKQHLDYVKSGEFHSEQQWREASPEERAKVNQGAAEFEAFLDSMPQGNKERFLEKYASSQDIGDGSRYLMSHNLESFGEAFRQSTPDDLNSNNTKILLATVITNAGGIMSHDVQHAAVNNDQVAFNMIRDGLVNSANQVPLVGFDANMAASLGYLGAMMAGSAMVMSSFENVISTKAEGRPSNEANDVDYAKRYAFNLSTFVNSRGFEAGAMAVVSERSNQLDQDQKTEIVNRLRVMMLSNALAAVLGSGEGRPIDGARWREAVEHPESLKGDPVTGDVAYSLATDIQTYLPANILESEKLKGVLEDFYNSTPENEELLSTNHSIKNAFVDHVPAAYISDK